MSRLEHGVVVRLPALTSQPTPLSEEARKLVIGPHHCDTDAGVWLPDDLTPVRIIYRL